MAKASGAPKVLYWDACVFISMIEGDPARIGIINALLDDIEQAKVVVYTSTLSIAEVAFGKAEKDQKALSPATEARIDALWSPESPFQLVDVHRIITLDARKLIRTALDAGLTLKPSDAIHLATAKKVQATEVHTYDRLDKKREELGNVLNLTIREPLAPPGRIIFPPDDSENHATVPKAKQPKKKSLKKSIKKRA